MKPYALAYIAGLVSMLALDSCWLIFVGPSLYWAHIGELLLDRPIIWASIAFYLVYQCGVVVLAVRPGLSTGRIAVATWHGAVLGFVAYATYDLTNNATLKIWSPVITVADIGWGTILTAIAASAGCAAGRWAGRA